MITALIVLAAIAWLLWPAKKPGEPTPMADLFKVPAVIPPEATPHAAGPDQRAAIDSLLAVRERLAATESLDEDSAKAVDVLWLDLLHGAKRK